MPSKAQNFNHFLYENIFHFITMRIFFLYKNKNDFLCFLSILIMNLCRKQLLSTKILSLNILLHSSSIM